jgi:hypothetical protein
VRTGLDIEVKRLARRATLNLRHHMPTCPVSPIARNRCLRETSGPGGGDYIDHPQVDVFLVEELIPSLVRLRKTSRFEEDW